MTKRLQKLLAAVVALAALALGGAVLAQAQSSSATPERTSAPDRDNVQSGDQTTADAPAGATAARIGHVRRSARRATSRQSRATSERPGTENTEQAGAESESISGSDGPGGHADESANVNADHQFQGNE